MKHKITPDDRRRIAQKVGVNEQYLYQCLTGRRDMNPEEAVRVETESGGEITRFDLCQKSGRGIWPEQAAAIEQEDAQASALRTGTARRHIARRTNDVPVDADRRHAGPPFYSVESGEA